MPLDPQEFAELVTTAIKTAMAPVVARLVVLEARAAVPGRDGRDGTNGAAGLDGKSGLDGQPGRDGRDGAPGAQGFAGQKGFDGVNGTDGQPGANGRDGTLDNLKAVYDGERTLTLCFKDGTPLDGGVIVLPIPIDRGVYRPESTYEKGDAVTYGGSVFIAQMPTAARPDDASRAWRLAVKHGREGKPGLNGKDGINGRDLTPTADARRY